MDERVLPRLGRPLFTVVGMTLAVSLTTGCGDDAVGLLGAHAAEDARLLELTGVPTLPSLAAAYGLAELAAAAATLSEDGDGASTQDVRVALLAPLADRLGPEGIQHALERLAAAADGLEGALTRSTSIGPLGEARRRMADARELLEAGRLPEALEAVLLGGEVLTRIPADAIVDDLVACADRGLRRIRARETYERVWSDRAQRLRVAALQALEQDERALAVRRAYYACKIVSRH